MKPDDAALQPAVHPTVLAVDGTPSHMKHRHRPAISKPLRGAAAALLTLTALAPAQALELNASGFATLGYARSDSDYTYQRFINRDGGFKRDSLLAGQLDLRLAPQWSATVQAKVSADENSDRGTVARTSWAFVAWRPHDDWLLRLGKARVPLYLYSESLDVGVASDMARLPHEMYSIVPTNDFDGLFVTRSFTWGPREISVEGYSGAADATARLWLRDGVPPERPAGPLFRTVRARVTGLVLTSRDEALTWRLGVVGTRTSDKKGQPLPVRFPRVELGPGIGYWQVDAQMPGPGIETVPAIRNLAVTAGAEWQFGSGWRLTGEAVRMIQRDTELGSDSKAGYLALFRRIGAFTPYASIARQRSSDGVLGWHDRLIASTVPAMLPGAGVINATQRAAGETLYAFDQRSFALGAAWALSPTAKLKGEWMRTRVGRASAHFDVPPGQADVAGIAVRTVTVNLNVAF